MWISSLIKKEKCLSLLLKFAEENFLLYVVSSFVLGNRESRSQASGKTYEQLVNMHL